MYSCKGHLGNHTLFYLFYPHSKTDNNALVHFTEEARGTQKTGVPGGLPLHMSTWPQSLSPLHSARGLSFLRKP